MAHHVDDTLRKADRHFAGAIGMHQHEFVAAKSRQHVAFGSDIAQPRRHRDQQLVAGIVPEAVVDVLEIVEVDIENAEPVAFVDLGAGLLQRFVECEAIGEAREAVEMRHMLDLRGDRLALGGVFRQHQNALIRRQIDRNHECLLTFSCDFDDGGLAQFERA